MSLQGHTATQLRGQLQHRTPLYVTQRVRTQDTKPGTAISWSTSEQDTQHTRVDFDGRGASANTFEPAACPTKSGRRSELLVPCRHANLHGIRSIINIDKKRTA